MQNEIQTFWLLWQVTRDKCDQGWCGSGTVCAAGNRLSAKWGRRLGAICPCRFWKGAVCTSQLFLFSTLTEAHVFMYVAFLVNVTSFQLNWSIHQYLFIYFIYFNNIFLFILNLLYKLLKYSFFFLWNSSVNRKK